MKTPIYFTLFLAGGISLAAGMALAQQQRPPKPDFSSVASALSVPEDALVSCLGDRPEKGQRPPRPDAAKVASCLNDKGFKVSEGRVDAALSAAAPKRQ